MKKVSIKDLMEASPEKDELGVTIQQAAVQVTPNEILHYMVDDLSDHEKAENKYYLKTKVGDMWVNVSLEEFELIIRSVKNHDIVFDVVKHGYASYMVLEYGDEF